MDADRRKELQELLEKLTHSGSSSLDENQMKQVKAVCRQSDTNVREVYRLVMKNLAKKHAEVRLSAFQIVNELFVRSNQFRVLVLSDFRKLAALVTGTDPAQPLPLPKDAAAKLKRTSLLAIREWNRKFSSGYPELRLGYNYLKFNRKVDFDELVADSEAERRRREQRDMRRRTILHQRIQEVKQEIEDLKKDLGSCLTEMEACFNLLLPRFDIPDIYQSQEDSEGSAGVFGKKLLRELVSSGGAASMPPVKKRRITTSSSCSFASLSGESESFGEEEEEEQDNVEGNGDVEEKRDRKQEAEECKREKGEGMKGTQDADEDKEKVLDSFMEEQLTATDEPNEEEKMVQKEVARNPEVTIRDLHSSLDEQRHGDMSEHSLEGRDDLSDSDSEVEWEDVPPGELCDGSPTDGGQEEVLQEHGLATRGLMVPVTLGSRVEVEETEDNSSILASLKENRQLLLVHFIPTLNKCLEWMTKAGEEESVRAAIDLKSHIHSALAKYNKLKITSTLDTSEPDKPVIPLQQDAAAPVAAIVTNQEWKFGSDILEAELELDPTTPHAQVARLKQKKKSETARKLTTPDATPSSAAVSKPPSLKEDLKSRAPVIPFDMDLYHWDEPSSKVEPRTLAPIGSLHRFWAEEKEVFISQDEQNRLKCRTISFPGSFQPVVKSCRALLPSGKLCPRKDRYKCPFHGPIIPRDQHGNPVQQTEQGRGGKVDGDVLGPSPSSLGEPLWKDEELQGDIMAATGVDIQVPTPKKGKGRGKRKAAVKYPGLTDLSTLTKNPRQRLENKLLSKRAQKRVAQDVDRLAAKKFDDKFGNNFNYALN